jgi:hypothetical protein
MRGQYLQLLTSLPAIQDLIPTNQRQLALDDHLLDYQTANRRDDEQLSQPSEVDDPDHFSFSYLNDSSPDRPTATMDPLESAQDVPPLPLHNTQD